MTLKDYIAKEVKELVDSTRYSDIVENIKRGMPVDDPNDVEFLWEYKQETPELLELVYG